MTLINKERLLKDLREKTPLDWDDDGEDYGILVSRIIVDEQPTVEAIPVDWIEEWMGYQCSWDIQGVKSLLRDWCKNCSNNSKNGGSGICHCVLGQRVIY